MKISILCSTSSKTHGNFLSVQRRGFNSVRAPDWEHITRRLQVDKKQLPEKSKMWDFGVLVLLICAVSSISAQSEAGKYRVIAPDTFTPGEMFTVAVEVMAASGPVHVNVEIEAYNYNYVNFSYYYLSIAGQGGDFNQGTPGVLSFKVPNYVALSTSGFRLHVRGTGGLQIDTRSDLRLQQVKASVFIQTDRQVYRPGQTVNFRTFSLRSSDLIPFGGSFTIRLTAPGGNLVKMWTASPALQFFTFDLDTHPPLGEWTIEAASSETGTRQISFNVEDYENPPFTVKLHIPRTMNTSQILEGSVEARYPQGVGVKGTVEVSLPTGYNADSVKTSVQIDGSANFSFSDLAYYRSSAEVTATVTEHSTGKTVAAKSTLYTYERNVRVQFTEKTPAVFRPGLPFTAYVQVTDQEDRPLHIPPDSIFRFVYVYGVGHYSTPSPDQRYGVSSFTGSYPILAKKMPLPESGFFPVELDIPTDVTQVDIRVTFQGVQSQLNLQSVQSSTSSYLQLTLLGTVRALATGQQAFASFRATSNKPLNSLKAQIVSRGQVLEVLTPSLTNVARAGDLYLADFQVELSWSMSPVADIIAYLNVGNKEVFELVADSIAFNVDGLLRNKVQLMADRQKVQPGETVTVTVQSSPNSAVGVLIQEDIGSRGNVITAEELIQRFVQGPRPSPPNDFVATSSIQSDGSFARLNLNVIDGWNSRSSATALVRQALFSNNADDDTAYPETIFFSAGTTGLSGSANFSVQLPDSVTTWVTTAFSYDNNGNLGVMDSPILIEAAREVYAELSAADHAVTGEQVIVRVDVHNARDVTSQVDVTLKPNFSLQGLVVGADGAAVKSSTDQTRTITVPAKSSSSVYFAVTATVDAMPVNTAVVVEVVSGTSRHVVRHEYTSVPEGVAQTVTQSKLIKSQGGQTSTVQLPLSVPSQAIKGSEKYHIRTESTGSNAGYEVYLPPLVFSNKEITEEGTGADAVLKLTALALTAEANPSRVAGLVPEMELAYQRLLAFYSNQFRIFANGGEDTWMRIAAVQAIARASKFITVDGGLIYGELSPFINTDLEGNLRSYSNPIPQYSKTDATNPPMTGIALAAYYAITLVTVDPAGLTIADASWPERYRGALNRTREYLRNTTGWSSEILNDTLATSYLAYATVLMGYDPSYLLNSLLQKAVTDSPSGEIYWNTPRSDKLRYYGDWQTDLHVARASDVTTASYALLTLLQTRRYSEALGVATWLIQQRDLRGAFRSAVDSLAATEALLAYYSHVTSSGGPASTGPQIQADGALVVKYEKQVTSTQLYDISLAGEGTALAQVKTSYRVTDDVGDEAYETVPVVLDETLGGFKLMVCSRRLLRSKSGPVVQRVDVPSGFLADTSGLIGQLGIVGVRRRNDTTITVYFSDMSDQSSCYTLPVRRTHPVAHTAPAYIVTRSFLEPENQGIASYQPRRLRESTVCDFCAECCTASLAP